ncbi:MAG: Hdr-like menaquinol oxidoreductase cytochrome c subunit [Gammaproteobacteria bacterium]
MSLVTKLTRTATGALALATLLAGNAAFAGDSLLPPYPKASASAVEGARQCVEPNDVMRRQHFQYILHQRDDTVHQGIRTSKHSLKGCVSCHAEKDPQGSYKPINAEGQFCQSCHAYTAVKIDCFECHATKPE